MKSKRTNNTRALARGISNLHEVFRGTEKSFDLGVGKFGPSMPRCFLSFVNRHRVAQANQCACLVILYSLCW